MDKLSQFELDILRRVGTPNQHQGVGLYGIYAFAVWNGREGIEMGPVRWGASTQDGLHYSCSPFPGAWTYVKESDILRVRHVHALSIPVGE